MFQNTVAAFLQSMWSRGVNGPAVVNIQQAFTMNEAASIPVKAGDTVLEVYTILETDVAGTTLDVGDSDDTNRYADGITASTLSDAPHTFSADNNIALDWVGTATAGSGFLLVKLWRP